MNNIELSIKRYKKGDKLAGQYGSGLDVQAEQDLSIASAYGIHADLFDMGLYYQCPSVYSESPGSGHFLEFLRALKAGLDKPVYFVNVTNQHIYKYLARADIGVKVAEDDFRKVVIQEKEATQ